MNQDSPFTLTRFEYEPQHLYYLPKALMAKLERAIPTYLVGSRGTGKTTLLAAVNWRERLSNDSLRMQLKGNGFESQYIGVYFKLPEIQLQAFDTWLQQSPGPLRAMMFGLYLDLNWLELVAQAISNLLVEDVLEAPPGEEHRCVSHIVEEVPEIGQQIRPDGPPTMQALSRAFARLRRRLEKLALSQRTAPSEVVEHYPQGQVGALGRLIAPQLADLCNWTQRPQKDRWYFKICMDEGETLTSDQQLMLNTLVRLSAWPAFAIVSFVRSPDDITTTLIPNLGLQEADRQLLVLDDITDGDFKKLADGVARIRVRKVLNDTKAPFKVDDLLGHLDLNELLEQILKESVSPVAKDLLENAKSLRQFKTTKKKYQDKALTDESGSAEPPPIYQAYLSKKLEVPLPSPEDERWRQRWQTSAKFRKRMVAAYLSICHETRTQVRYASADMLLQMCDKCMRDFLAQMDELYRQSGRPLRQFLLRSIPLATQYSALRKASERKRDVLPTSAVRAPAETLRLVDALARITAIIQSRGANNRHLLSSERGRFVLERDSVDGDDGHILKLLGEAGEIGYLRLLESEGASWRFRVHTSLAAAYQFSYRGAYYDTRITMHDLDRVRTATDRDEYKKAVAEIGGRLAGEDPTAELPFEGVRK